VDNHSRAAAPPKNGESSDRHFSLARTAYEKVTSNRWRNSGSDAYEENGPGKLPAQTIISPVEAVAWRTPAKINSFNYFVKELVALQGPRNHAWQKKQLEKIVRRIRDTTAGHAGYSAIDFLDDVKCACAREGVQFDDDVFNELVG
jgi:hypothetical protein